MNKVESLHGLAELHYKYVREVALLVATGVITRLKADDLAVDLLSTHDTLAASVITYREAQAPF